MRWQQGDTNMQTPTTAPGRMRRTVNDLVVAEMLLVQATIESATVIGEGFNELVSRREEAHQDAPESIADKLQRIADAALEPYSSSFKVLRNLIRSDNS
jgi:hypothetical protein